MAARLGSPWQVHSNWSQTWCAAEWASTETNRAQVAHRLDEQQKNHTRQRRGIVRHRPDQYQESGCPQQKDQNGQAHLAVEKSEWQSWQKQQSTPPEVGAAAASQFFNGNPLNVRPRVLIVFAFPAVVEIFELLIVILNRLFGMVPQK